MTLCTLLITAAFGQDLPDEPPPPAPTSGHPKHVIVPDPYEDQEKTGKAAPTGTTRRARARAEPSVPPRIARKTPRPVEGDAPDNVHGRYKVVEVTVAEVTEDFPNKMERAGRALNEDCIVTHQIFDFGALPEAEELTGHRPSEISMIKIRQCEVGGLGKYADEIEMILPATWGSGEGHATLAMPDATVMTDFVRLRQPTEGDMPTPPQWLAPDSSIDDGALSYRVVAERTRRGTDQAVLHLFLGEQILHLEPDDGTNPLDTMEQEVADGG
ncbi:MAG: hypothetical protein KTR31_39855 [Myxococcales bacterium]|nr:hypothetical protein [Myxococcales bacterium]